MTEVAPAFRAMVLGCAENQCHDLIALTAVLQGASAGRFDPHPVVLTGDARRALGRSGIDLDPVVAVDPFDLKILYA